MMPVCCLIILMGACYHNCIKTFFGFNGSDRFYLNSDYQVLMLYYLSLAVVDYYFLAHLE